MNLASQQAYNPLLESCHGFGCGEIAYLVRKEPESFLKREKKKLNPFGSLSIRKEFLIEAD